MTAAPTTRISLLLKLRDENDQVAWERFVTLYAPVVYGFARRKGLADAADIAQNVLLSVVQQMRKWTYSSERGSFRGWLFTIARNRLKNWRSSTARRMDGIGGDDHHDALQAEADPASDVEEWDAQYAQQTLHLAADIVRQQVSEQTWLAFEMTALAGTSGAAVAESLGISVGAVYLARGRVMARLKDQVQQIGDE